MAEGYAHWLWWLSNGRVTSFNLVNAFFVIRKIARWSIYVFTEWVISNIVVASDPCHLRPDIYLQTLTIRSKKFLLYIRFLVTHNIDFFVALVLLSISFHDTLHSNLAAFKFTYWTNVLMKIIDFTVKNIFGLMLANMFFVIYRSLYCIWPTSPRKVSHFRYFGSHCSLIVYTMFNLVWDSVWHLWALWRYSNVCITIWKCLHSWISALAWACFQFPYNTGTTSFLLCSHQLMESLCYWPLKNQFKFRCSIWFSLYLLGFFVHFTSKFKIFAQFYDFLLLLFFFPSFI